MSLLLWYASGKEKEVGIALETLASVQTNPELPCGILWKENYEGNIVLYDEKAFRISKLKERWFKEGPPTNDLEILQQPIREQSTPGKSITDESR